VSVVERDRVLGPAIAEVIESGALPRVDLAMVLAQNRREVPVDESAKGAAGLELGQLVVITDEHELALHRGDRVDEH
jgi:hypothetical protein